MKKWFVIVVSVLAFSLNSISVSAEEQHKHDSVGMEQAFDQFMLMQFQNEINRAVKDYYQKDLVRVQYNWFDNKYDVVEIMQSEKGRQLSHSYILKFTVQSYSEDDLLGTDTITFGVESALADGQNLAAVKVERLDFEHNKYFK
ncbi:DUF3888 domain-containing protein [Pseudalkalibacillus berkeleyi]|uniref:DUF3888 domain-containing protein n=1 Tax=Pseudalkalibacillus berkeleyi TaxID=1069813 RepID=A0ABS9H4Y2_9BACL|nr:DUF3888 domain-containing protein [Pseudalkalibacillus berkeleyi]MCF6138848.1 DUF3888 domain-containing protein [Pseudalkalibacillus berkeleyi]